MNYCKIGEKEYNVLVMAIEENFTILYGEGTGRSVAPGARMILNPLGTFFGHKVTVKRKQGFESEFDKLFNFLAQPRYDGIMVNMVHDQTSIEYEAYVSNGARKINHIDIEHNKVYWDAMDINIIPMEAQVVPE